MLPVMLRNFELRTIIASGHAGVLASLVPGRFLFHATRPSGLKLGA